MTRRDETRQEQSHSRNFIKRILISLCLISISLVTWKTVYAVLPDRDMGAVFAQSNRHVTPNITLSAASGATIPFVANANREMDLLPADHQRIPHLVLYRNGELTALPERTLDITLSSLEAPATGITVTLKLETQHGDPDLGGGDRSRITVWQASKRIEAKRDAEQTSAVANLVDASFQVVFGATITGDAGHMSTPTDYYRLEASLLDAGGDSRALFSTKLDHAFLLERQWTAALGSPGSPDRSGPQELVVYACDMIPFQGNAANRLSRTDVPGYIQNDLLPQMLEAIHLQTSVWGFSWDGWMSFGDSPTSERLGVALSDGETWYHGPVPDRGNSSIAINVNGGDNAEYDSLTDGLMSTFHHELFHNFQRAIAFTAGGSGDPDGKQAAWQFFAEGMASFVPSVAQPDIQFTQSREPRAYVAKAVQFVGGRGFPGGLNESYTSLNPYHAAIYWRYLYEQCSGMSVGAENPRNGMAVIRRSLQVLYSQELVDINAFTDLVPAMPRIMDRVLTSPEAASCPFHSYEASLVGFAEAIYSLKLEGGRCTAPAVPTGCGFYDPASLYSTPKSSKISYTGNEIEFSAEDQPYPAGIRSSFGMDFIELQLGSESDGQSLTIQLEPQAPQGAQFNLQIIRLRKQGGGFSSPRMVQVSPAEVVWSDAPGIPLSVSIPALELDSYNQIGVIITRVDANEASDPSGAYTLTVTPSQ